MQFVVRIDGPGVNRELTVAPEAQPWILGRDPSAAVHLPDPGRSISRRHLLLQWSAQGVQVSVLSNVNGLTTQRGEIGPGQESVLQAGEVAHMGMYRLSVEAAPAGTPEPADLAQALAYPVPATHDDPFAALSPRMPPARPVAPPADPFDALDGGLAVTPVNSFSGLAPPASARGAVDLALFDASPANLVGGANAPSRAIDNLLRGSSAGHGLGSAEMFKAREMPAMEEFAPNHVHPHNLPFAAPGVFAREAFDRPQPTAPAVAASPLTPGPAKSLELPTSWFGEEDGQALQSSADPFLNTWSGLQGAFDTPKAVPLPAAAGTPQTASTHVGRAAQPSPEPVPPVGSTRAAPTAIAPVQPPQQAAGQDVLIAFCRGLGVPVPAAAAGGADWEALGRTVRSIVEGMSDLMAARRELKRELRAEDRTMLGAKDNNPLKNEMSVEDLILYLLFNPGGVGGYMPANESLSESLTDLRAHELASIVASRAAMEGVLKQFAPEQLRKQLEKRRPSLALGQAWLWKAYEQDYHAKGQHLADWLEQIFNQHFMPAYLRESARLRGAAAARPRTIRK